MKNLILALNKANLSNSDIELVLTEFEIWIDSKVKRSEQKVISESIAPIQKETDGIRTEIRLLAETMKHGFAVMEERFQRMDQKQDFIRKNLEMEIISARTNLEMQIASTRKNLELQMTSSRENLETQIKANEKQLGLVQKLLWIVLTLVLGFFAKVIHLF